MVVHARRSLISTASKLVSVSGSKIPKFPPKEALYDAETENPFNPEIWAQLQPPSTSELSAFSHRIGLESILTPEIALQACTHPSYVQFYQRYMPNTPKPSSNGQWASIGNALLGLFATEYYRAAYPYLPTRALKAAVTAQVGPLTSSNIGQEMGATPLMRWHRSSTPYQSLTHNEALASVPRSLTALVYQKQSLSAARKFVQSYFMSREVDLRGMLKFHDPKMALVEMISKLGRDWPKSRLLKETGRFSNTPVFVVGIFSGLDQIGEGFGSSLKMAEFRAAEDALLRVYLTKTPNELINVPSSTFPAVDTGDIYTKGSEGTYKSPGLVFSEVMYASSHKSGATPASSRQSVS